MADNKDNDNAVDAGRRGFLGLLPLGALAGMAATLSIAAARFLQPRAAATALAKWTMVGKIAELNGPEPIQRNVTVAQEVGWTIANTEQTVFVLPAQKHQVVSAICPHEGCPVEWDKEAKNFLCPCHDSRFSDSGVHLSGPSKGNMTPVASKIEDGVLQVQLNS